jgi:hypothetical protein
MGHENREGGDRKMSNRIRMIGASLSVLVGLVLVSGVAWANPNKEPVSGWITVFRVTEWGESWIDDDGVTHWRNRLIRMRMQGNIAGVYLGVERGNYDPSTGDGDNHGSFVFNGYVGEDSVSATGRFAGVRSGLPGAWEVDFVGHLDDGRLIKMTIVKPAGEPPTDYVGEILDPPGRR